MPRVSVSAHLLFPRWTLRHDISTGMAPIELLMCLIVYSMYRSARLQSVSHDHACMGLARALARVSRI